MPNQSRPVEMPHQVWQMIEQCLKSGLYGETIDEVVLALMRPGLIEAFRIGIAKTDAA